MLSEYTVIEESDENEFENMARFLYETENIPTEEFINDFNLNINELKEKYDKYWQ